MRIRHPWPTIAAILSGVAVVLFAWWAGAARLPATQPATAVLAPVRNLPPVGSAARRSIDRCREHVTIIYDVHWAAACMMVAAEQKRLRLDCLLAGDEPGKAPSRCAQAAAWPVDDSVDCTLPTAHAAQVNRARDGAEAFCYASSGADRRVVGAGGN